MSVTEARQRFAELIELPQGAFRLAEGALLIAFEEYPQLDVAAYLKRLDTIAEIVQARLGLELDPQRIVAQMNAYLFDEQGFRGNQTDYYDPRNSFLNDVLERKTGIPITLSVIYLEIGRQVGLPTVGVGMPGHFLVQYAAHGAPFWIDPFHGGVVLNREDCMSRVERMYGPQVTWSDNYLLPVSDHDILMRMLYNLKAIYVQRNDYQRALSVVERLMLLRPTLLMEIRDRGLLLAQLERYDAALEDLQHYLQLAPNAPDAATVQRQIAVLRQQRSP
jgi:regulator of sirC expression with transglutaminase-like and TPR domain